MKYPYTEISDPTQRTTCRLARHRRAPDHRPHPRATRDVARPARCSDAPGITTAGPSRSDHSRAPYGRKNQSGAVIGKGEPCRAADGRAASLRRAQHMLDWTQVRASCRASPPVQNAHFRSIPHDRLSPARPAAQLSTRPNLDAVIAPVYAYAWSTARAEAAGYLPREVHLQPLELATAATVIVRHHGYTQPAVDRSIDKTPHLEVIVGSLRVRAYDILAVETYSQAWHRAAALKIRQHWHEAIRAAAKTVSVPNDLYPTDRNPPQILHEIPVRRNH